METCVLLPPELSVVLRPYPYTHDIEDDPKPTENCSKIAQNGAKIAQNDSKIAQFGSPEGAGPETASGPALSRGSRPASPVNRAGGGVWEMGATVWSNCRLLAGMTFTPDEGSVRLETLEIYKKLRPDDVSFVLF